MTFPRQFPEALRDLGYVDKQNLILEWRSADGRPDRLADLAADLVRVKADVIVAVANPDILAAKRATTTIPIVMVAASDPVGAGLVASLARPGGNITGRTWTGPETVGKQLELLKETVPTITRVVHLGSAGVPGVGASVQAAQAGAQALGLTLRVMEVRPTDDVALLLADRIIE
jgi:putative tryptophan/tyrosine transport system substrate-binding protein